MLDLLAPTVLEQVADVIDAEKAGFLPFDKLIPALCNHHMIEDYVAIVPDRMAIS